MSFVGAYLWVLVLCGYGRPYISLRGAYVNSGTYINICIATNTNPIQMQSPKYVGCASRKVPSDDGNFSVWKSRKGLGIELHIQGSHMANAC